MRKTGKRILILLGVAVALVAVAVIVLVLSFDINAYKQRIEKAVSEATGCDVRIDGRMALSFRPFRLSAEKLHASCRGAEVLSLESLRMEVAFKPLLKRQLRITSCELVRPTVTVVKGVDGRYRFERSARKPTAAAPGPSFTLDRASLSKGTLLYLDEGTGERAEAKGIDIALRDFLFMGAEADICRAFSFTGELECRSVRVKDLQIDNVKGRIEAAKGVIRLTRTVLDAFGAKAQGNGSVDLSGKAPVYGVDLDAPNLDFERLQEAFGAKKVIGGRGDLRVSLTAIRKGDAGLLGGTDGTISLQGDNLILYPIDLDKLLTSYEKSQGFDLVDLGAIFVAGPLSPVALKVYRYGEVYRRTREGEGTVTRFISHWRLENGIAEAADCALSTLHHRVALTGKLNLVGEQFENVTVALLDKRGCATSKQSITGSFAHPKVSVVGPVKSLVNEVVGLFKKGEQFLFGDKCEVFYHGEVAQP